MPTESAEDLAVLARRMAAVPAALAGYRQSLTWAADGGKVADTSPSNYSRGEGQKPVSKAYKDNWNAIFAKKKKR